LPGRCLLILLPMVAVTVPKDVWREKVSENVYNVELSGNGPYGFVYAFFHNSLDYNRYYLEEDESHVREYLRNALSASNVTFTGSTDKMDVTRRVENRNALTDRKPNVVLITVESLSSKYMAAFNGTNDWTPNLDKIARKSLVFSRMYATGTRTVRGLEAIALAVPPTPGQSILRRPDYAGLFTLGNAMNQAGYRTDFLYGGYGYFDNMNAFYEGNGFTVYDRLSIPKEKSSANPSGELRTKSCSTKFWRQWMPMRQNMSQRWKLS
jgi:phosphoglycerol transferase MdoB-like AlkP superfamily enzyme